MERELLGEKRKRERKNNWVDTKKHSAEEDQQKRRQARSGKRRYKARLKKLKKNQWSPEETRNFRQRVRKKEHPKKVKLR